MITQSLTKYRQKQAAKLAAAVAAKQAADAAYSKKRDDLYAIAAKIIKKHEKVGFRCVDALAGPADVSSTGFTAVGPDNVVYRIVCYPEGGYDIKPVK